MRGTSQVESNVEIRIYNMAGKIISKLTEVISPGHSSINWDLSNIAPGVYVYKVYQQGSSIGQKGKVVVKK